MSGLGVRLGVRLATLRVLWTLAHPRRELTRGVRVERDLTLGGIACDHYLSERRRRIGAPLVVALHGATLNGKDDDRLRHFAATLAAAGVPCLVPSLPGLCRLTWTRDDVTHLVSLTREAAARFGLRLVLVGFSYGGSYALIAAAREGVRELVDAVVAFGAFHDLDATCTQLMASHAGRPTQQAEWDDWIYMQLVQAYRHGEALHLPATLRAEVERRLREHCHSPDLDGKRRFYEEHLAHFDLFTYDFTRRDRAELAAVSPAGKLAGFAGWVGLIHDINDLMVPPSQAKALYEELQARPAQRGQELLVTTLLNHVSATGGFALGEVWRLAGIMAALLGTPPPSLRSPGQ